MLRKNFNQDLATQIFKQKTDSCERPNLPKKIVSRAKQKM